MSDDEDEGCLQIDESTSDSEDRLSTLVQPPPTIMAVPSSSYSSDSNARELVESSGKEEGELDEEEEENESMDTDEKLENKLEVDGKSSDPLQIPADSETVKVESEEKIVKYEKREDLVPQSSSPYSSKLIGEKEIKREEGSEDTLNRQERDTPTSSDKPKSKSPTPSSKKENGLMKPPQITEKPHRKRKESTDSFPNEKRKSGIETIAASSTVPSSTHSTTPQRSKRSSSHMATLAISACFTEEDIVSVPMMPIQKTPDAGSQSKRSKRDASTNVITSRSTDTSGLLCNETIMDTPPGSQLTLELTVMYRTKNSLAFRVKGCDLIGFIGDGLPPMASPLATNNSSTSNNKKKANNLLNEEGKDGRSSSASSNGRGTRGGSVVKEGKNEKHKGKRKKEEYNDDDMDDENQNNEHYGSRKSELIEVDSNLLHDCHYDGCEKRFQKSMDLEYHISKNHKKRVMVYESICTQTDISPVKTQDVGTEIDDDLPPTPQMPVLKKEVPIKVPIGHIYEDLSDDDSKPTDLVLKTPSSSSAAAALMGIAQASSSTTAPSIVQSGATPSTQVSGKIGINPSMVVQVNAHNAMTEKSKHQQQQQQQRSVFVTHSPRPNQPSVSQIPSSSSTTPSAQPPPPIIQGHPMAGPHFIPPGFHPGIMHAGLNHPHMAAIVAMSQQQQMSRTPSRQTMTVSDSHKIHELAKSKENEQRQRQQAGTPKTSAGSVGGVSAGAVTPQRQFLPPQMVQPPPGASQSLQQQQAAAAAAQHQHQQLMQLQLQMQMGMVPTNQPELLRMMIGMGIPIGPAAAPVVPGFPGPQQQPK